ETHFRSTPKPPEQLDGFQGTSLLPTRGEYNVSIKACVTRRREKRRVLLEDADDPRQKHRTPKNRLGRRCNVVYSQCLKLVRWRFVSSNKYERGDEETRSHTLKNAR